MIVMERENPVLREVLPKDYAREALDKQRLGRVIDLVSGINLAGVRGSDHRRAGPRVRVLP